MLIVIALSLLAAGAGAETPTPGAFSSTVAETAGGSIAVRAPGEAVGAADTAGIIALIEDDPTGTLVVTGNQALHPSTPNVPGSAELLDYFGYALSAGDGMLHIGIPGETVSGQDYAGAAGTVHFNGAGRIDLSEPSYQYHPDTPGFASAAEFDDEFGGSVAGPGRRPPAAGSLFASAVALADLDENGVSDLVIGAPGADAGAGRGTAEWGDAFGTSIAGLGFDGIAVGAPGEVRRSPVSGSTGLQSARQARTSAARPTPAM